MRVFLVPNESEALRRQEQRKSSQRDARRRGLPALREPKYKMKRDACKAKDERELVSIACVKLQEAAAKRV
ncbi:hypothetical protein A3841_13120 [Pontibacter flavimaris]|uniref:Uncharacterized protein n=1 Tax=Pontibacter flavimaris TaxID=1797110 RepID=A0A1Q5PEW5_9BACT|nr:hypothetical protein A3841_13120 [Pontibacter flavimaris]